MFKQLPNYGEVMSYVGKGNRNQIALLGVPSDTGAGLRGSSMGPEALRVAGLASALRRLGYTVTDTGNVNGPPNPEARAINGYRHLREVQIWCAALRERVAEQLEADQLPITLGGDHAFSMGSIAAVSDHCRRHDKPLWVIWLDAHADFNTPDSSPSGNLHGMPAAVTCGVGHADLLALSGQRMLDPKHLVQIGVRSIDEIERKLVNQHGIAVFDMRHIDEFGIRTTMNTVLNEITDANAHIHVSFDVDSLDPEIAPGVGTRVDGGLNYREAQLCMEMLFDYGRIGSLDIMEINPAVDTNNRTAKLAVELVESLFGKQILSRPAIGF